MIYNLFHAFHSTRFLCGIAILLLLQGCATSETMDFGSQFESPTADLVEDEQEEVNEGNNTAIEPAVSSSTQLESISGGPPLPAKSSSEVLALSDEKNISIAFDGVELAEFVNHALSNILNVNFVLAPNVEMKGKTVTLEIKEKISQREFLSLFEDLLSQHGLVSKIQEGIIFVHNSSQVRGRPDLDFGYGREDSDVPVGSDLIYQLVPVYYIGPKSLHSFLVRLANAGVELSYDPNIIALQGKRYDILRALSIIRMLDVPGLLGHTVVYMQLEYLPSEEFIKKVTDLLESDGVNVGLGVRFTDLSRQNGVVVHSNNQALLDRISYWREKLDTPESSDDLRYFMYYPQNMEASKLADVLMRFESISSTTGPSASNSKSSAQKQSSEGGSKEASLSGVANDFSFVTDENRNVIVIYSTATKYKTMLPLLKKLDVTPPQVLIEAKLIEITLTDQFSQGVEWSLFGGAAKRDLSTSQVASYNSGSFAYTISGIDYNAVLSLLQSKDQLKVLSSPRIVVSNGERATMNVGTEIPVLTTQSTDVDSDRVLQSIQYRSTGVDLSVKPVVNSNSVVAMEISQNVSETSGNSTSSLNSPLILNRSFNTSVIARSGQTLVLGGLIRENNSSTDSSLPILGDIPGLGALFSSKSKSKSRTELVVLITAKIIHNSSDIDELRNLFIDELELF